LARVRKEQTVDVTAFQRRDAVPGLREFLVRRLKLLFALRPRPDAAC
jgi:hypothetical protein